MRELQVITKDLSKRAVDQYGEENQKLMALEEMGELITALLHERRKKATAHQVVSEIADVCLIMESLKHIYGYEEVENFIFSKAYRLKKTLENEKS